MKILDQMKFKSAFENNVMLLHIKKKKGETEWFFEESYSVFLSNRERTPCVCTIMYVLHAKYVSFFSSITAVHWRSVSHRKLRRILTWKAPRFSYKTLLVHLNDGFSTNFAYFSCIIAFYSKYFYWNIKLCNWKLSKFLFTFAR